MTPVRPWGRVVLRLVLTVGVLCVLSLWGAPAQAHATLVSTDPAEGAVLQAPPESLTLTFDEPVTLAEDGAQLYNAAGETVPAQARSVDRTVVVSAPAEMPEGTYMLTYRVISADSHPVAGALTFAVGAPSETVTAPTGAPATAPGSAILYAALHAIMYLCLFTAAGLAMFAAVLLPTAPHTQVVRSRLRRWAVVAAVAAGGAAVLLAPVAVLYQQGLDLTGLAQSLPWSSWWSADGVLAALVLLGLTMALAPWRRLPQSAAARAVVVAGAAVALAAVAVVGHTRSYGPPALVVTADILHVLAAATWFGGLLGLVVALRLLVHRHQLAAQTLSRFSTAAAGSLVAVAVAGVVLGWRILGSWSALVTTTYGLILVGKVTLVAVVAAVAAWNRFRLLPSVVASDRGGDPVAVTRRLAGTVRVEAIGLAAVLALTGVLVTQVPQSESAARAAEQQTVLASTDEIRLVAHVHPGRIGKNTVTVQVQDRTGEPVEPFASPTVSVSSDGVDLGSQPTRNISSGTYTAQFVIPRPGTWTVQVSVRTSEFDNPVLSLETEIEAVG